MGGEGRCGALLGRLLGRGQCREAGEPTLRRRSPPLVFLFSLPTVSEKSSLYTRVAETQEVPSSAETSTGSPVPVSHLPPSPAPDVPSLLPYRFPEEEAAEEDGEALDSAGLELDAGAWVEWGRLSRGGDGGGGMGLRGLLLQFL